MGGSSSKGLQKTDGGDHFYADPSLEQILPAHPGDLSTINLVSKAALQSGDLSVSRLEMTDLPKNKKRLRKLLQKNPALSSFSFTGRYFSAHLLFALAECCPELEELTLRGMKLPSRGFSKAQVAYMRQPRPRRLHTLVLDYCVLDRWAYQEIATFWPQLRHLSLTETGATDDDLLCLRNGCRNLESVGLRSLPTVSAKAMASMVKDRPSLTAIDISGNGNLGQTLRLLGQTGSPSVLRLKADSGSAALRKERGISDEHLVALAGGCPSLRELDLSNLVTEIQGSGFAEGFRELQILRLGSKAMDDPGLESISVGCPNLRELDLRLSKKVTLEGIAAFARACQQLAVLLLSGEHLDNAAAIRALEGTSVTVFRPPQPFPTEEAESKASRLLQERGIELRMNLPDYHGLVVEA